MCRTPDLFPMSNTNHMGNTNVQRLIRTISAIYASKGIDRLPGGKPTQARMSHKKTTIRLLGGQDAFLTQTGRAERENEIGLGDSDQEPIHLKSIYRGGRGTASDG